MASKSVQHLFLEGRSLCGRAQNDKPSTHGCADCARRAEGTGRYAPRARAKRIAREFSDAAKAMHMGGKAFKLALRIALGPARGRALIVQELRAIGLSSRALPDYRQGKLGGGADGW